MANPEQLLILKNERVQGWNYWRAANPDSQADLSGADLSGYANLSEANFSQANLREANFSQADLSNADLRETKLLGANFSNADLRWAHLDEADLIQANLNGARLISADLNGARLIQANLNGAKLNWANLIEAYLGHADLRGADLSGAKLPWTELSMANLSGACLVGADLQCATLIHTNLKDANLTGARVYGISSWDVKTEGALQADLIITPSDPSDQPEITVDNIEVAQFIYLILNNARIRDVIDTITSKAVLILGSFNPERKATLDALRDALRDHNYLPIVFDFKKPISRDLTETVSTLAHLARFVIADLSDPRSIPQELTAVVPRLLSVPIRTLLLASQSEWGMFSDLARYRQVIPPFHYTDDAMLLSCLESDIIAPAEQKVRELRGQ